MKLLCVYNIASHYRAPIFRLLDQEFDCDFVAGDRVSDIKKMDYSALKHGVKEVHNVQFRHSYWQKGVLGLIRAKYDSYLILGETRCLSTWVLLFLSIFYPKKHVYLWSHGWYGKENRVKRLLGKLFYSFCDGAFIYNNRSRILMANGGIDGNKLYTIYNSLDYDVQLSLRQSLSKSSLYYDHFRNNYKVIVFIGRLTKVKRLEMILYAVNHLRECGEYYNVVFVGDGEERDTLEALSNNLGLNKMVWFYGASYNESINAQFIYNADLCVSPGNIGLTAMHVMMFGCPAITNDDFNHQMPEFEAILEGRTGSFFHAGDFYSLSEAISHWFAMHGTDRDLVRQACFDEIDSRWNPHNQISIFKRVLLNE